MREPEELSTCPICERSDGTRRMKRLYGMLVCRRCWGWFANRREIAYVIDYACYLILFLLLPLLLLPVELLGDAFMFVNLFVILPLLFACKDGFSGQSPGKWLLGVRVVDNDTLEPIGFKQSLKRNLILIIPLAWLLIEFQLLKGDRSGDKWANTRVILKKYAHRAPFDIRGILCTNCGYNLTGNVSGRCPECGRAIPAAPRAVPLAVPVGPRL